MHMTTILVIRDEENLWNVYNLLKLFLSIGGLEIITRELIAFWKYKMLKETKLDWKFQLEKGKWWGSI
jgi:hypothetical protein